MKRLHVYIEKEGIADALRQRLQDRTLGLHNFEFEEPEVCIHSVSNEFLRTILDKDALVDLGLGDWKESLYLTDIPVFAALLGSGDYPVLAYVHEGNRDKSFEKVNYIIEGFEDVDMEYFVRVWKRLVGKPWHILDTERCSIRETTVEDLDAFYELYSEPSITEFMEDLFPDRQEEKAYIETYAKTVYGFYGFGMWTVVLKETGQVIGRAGISMREGFDDPELGFMIGVPWQGQGIAKEVCLSILQYAKEELGFDKVQALVKPENGKSIMLLEKLGFTFEAETALEDGTYQLYVLEK